MWGQEGQCHQAGVTRGSGLDRGPGTWGLTVVVVRDHVAIPVVGERRVWRGRQGLQGRPCGWACERAEGPEPQPAGPPPPAPILLIRSVLSSGSSTRPGGSAFSGRWGFLLLGGGLGCFWRRMYSTAGRGRSERGSEAAGRGPRRDGGRTHSPRSPPARSGHCSPAWAAPPPPPALGKCSRSLTEDTLPPHPAHPGNPES